MPSNSAPSANTACLALSRIAAEQRRTALAFFEAIGDAMLIVINSSASTVANLAPVPGGMGVAEAGLVAGLTAAGIDNSRRWRPC